MNTLLNLSPDDVRAIVDAVITPEFADDEAPRLVRLIFAITDPDNDEGYQTAQIAARHAFAKTSLFEEAFLDFAALPQLPPATGPRELVIELDDQN